MRDEGDLDIIKIKESIQEDVTLLNRYEPNVDESICIKQY